MKKNLFICLLMMCMAVTAVAQTSYPLNESFEGSTLPSGWTVEYQRTPIAVNYNQSDCGWFVEGGNSLTFPASAAKGSGRAASRNTTGDELRYVTRLVTPAFSLAGLLQPQLVFSHAEPIFRTFSDTLRIYYRTSPSAAWKPYPNVVYAGNNDWKEEVLPLIGQSTSYQLAFEITENMGRGVLLDNVFVRPLPTCQPVEDIQVSPIHAYDAQVIWNVLGDYYDFEALLTTSPVEDFDAIDPAIVVSRLSGIENAEVHLTELTPETEYHIYIRTACDKNHRDYTDWRGTSFTTLKVAYLPYFESFNNAVGFDGNTAYGMAEGWTIGGNVTDVNTPYVYCTNTASVRQSFSVDSTAFLAFQGGYATTSLPVPSGKYAYVATPEVVTDDIRKVQIDFWATAYNRISAGADRYAAKLYVAVMVDPYDLGSMQIVDSVSLETAYQFKHCYVNFSSYQGTGKFVALLSRSTYQNAIYVDNFHAEETSAFVPTSVRARLANSLGFTVEANAAGADSWEVMVAKSYSRSGDVEQSDVLLTRTGLTAGSEVIADASLTGQTVLVYTRAKKGAAYSEWSFPVTVRVPKAIDSYPCLFSFESSNGQVALSTLGQEFHQKFSQKGSASTYFPLTNFDVACSNWPVQKSTKPNRKGVHLQLTGIDNWFTLPETDTISTLQMVFYYATPEGSMGRLQVGVMVDPYDLSTFTPLTELSMEATTYTRCLVAFDSYQGQGKYIAFRSLDAGSGNEASVCLIDEVLVSKLGRCREANSVSVEAHSHSVDITWNGSGMDGWIVGLSSSNRMLNAEYKTVTTDSVTFTGLESESTYYYTISTMCGDSLLPAEQIYTFSTPRGLPVEQAFATSSMPSDWSRATGDVQDVFAGGELTTTSYGWSTTTSYSDCVFAPQSGYAAYITTSSAGHNWLLSPVVYADGEPDADLRLEFDMGIHGYAGYGVTTPTTSFDTNDRFMVLISEDGGRSWKADNAIVWSNQRGADYQLNSLKWEAAQSYDLDLSAYVGKKIQVAFYLECISHSGSYNYISIDNVRLRINDPRCGHLTNLSATGFDNGGTITWTLGGQNPYPAIVQLSNSSKFTTILRTDTVQGSRLTYSDLEAGSRYYVRAHQDCQNDMEWRMAEFRTPCLAVTPDDLGELTFDNETSVDCWTTGFLFRGSASAQPPHYTQAAGFGGVLEISKPTTDTTSRSGAYAIMPAMLIDSIEKYQVVFRAATYKDEPTNVHTLHVAVVTDPTSPGSSIVRMKTINLSLAKDSDEMRTYEVSFESYPGDPDGERGKYIAFYSDAADLETNYVYIDNVFVEAVHGCHQVLDLEATRVGARAATVTWSNNGAESYELMATSIPVKPDTVLSPLATTITTDTTWTITDLQSESDYYVYIRSLCGESDHSRWSSAVHITTAFGVPFVEPFEASLNPSVWTKGSLMFQGDSVQGRSISTYSGWNIEGPSYMENKFISGMQGYMLRNNVWGTGVHAWLISPELSLQDVADDELIDLSFEFAMVPWSSSASSPIANYGEDDRMGVLISTNGGATWKASDAYFFDFSEVRGEAQTFSLSLNAYRGQSIRFAIYDESTLSNADNDFVFDSIRVTVTPSYCSGVRNLSVKLDDRDDRAAIVRWSRYGEPRDVKLEVSSSADFANAQNYQSTLDSVVITGLRGNTTYYVRATQMGCPDAVPVVTSFRSRLAIPYSENFAGATLPSKWTVMSGSVDSAFVGKAPVAVPTNTTAWKVAENANGLPANHLLCELKASSSYTEKWLVSPEISIMAEDGADVRMLFDLAFTAAGKATAGKADADQRFYVLLSTDDGQTWSETNAWQFSEAQTAFMHLSDISATGQRITIPMSDYVGQRVRVAFYRESQTATSDLHIANFRLRQYSASCPTPSAVTLDAVGAGSATLSWQGLSGTTSYVELAQTSAFDQSQMFTVVGEHSLQLSDLEPATTYYVRVSQLCEGDIESDVTNAFMFSTLYGLPYIPELSDQLPGGWVSLKDNTGVTDNISLLTPDSLLGTALTGNWKGVSATGSCTQKNSVYCARPSANSWLISPEIDLRPNQQDKEVTLSFDMALTSAYNTNNSYTLSTALKQPQHFHVVVSTDGGKTWSRTTATTWSNTIGNCDYSFNAIPSSAQTYKVSLKAYRGQVIRVALVRGAAPSGTCCITINNIRFDAVASTCYGVKSIESETTATSAALTLHPADNGHRWEIAWGEQGQAIADMATRPLSDTLTTLTGLHAGMVYDVYARSFCQDEEDPEEQSSAWCGPFRITMPAGLPYFNSASSSAKWTAMRGDVNQVFADQATLMSTTSGWSTTTSSSYSFGKPHLYCINSGSYDYWLVSEPISLVETEADDKVYLSTSIALTSSSTSILAPTNTRNHGMVFAVSTDDGATWQRVYTWLDETTDAAYTDILPGDGSSWRIDLTRFKGEMIRLAFVSTHSSYGSSTLHIADVEIGAFAHPCFRPAVDEVKSGSKELQVIMKPDTLATAYQYAVGAVGFTPTDADAVTVIGDDFLVTDLHVSSYYDLYVRSLCGSSDTSAWAGPYRAETLKGIPYYESMNWTSVSSEWSRNSGALGNFTSTTSGWKVSTSGMVWPTYHMMVNTWNTYKYALVSPEISLLGIGSKRIMLSFDMALTKYNSVTAPTNTTGQTFEVLVSIDGGQTWESDPSRRWEDNSQAADYGYTAIPATGRTYQLDLSDYEGESVMLAFYTSSIMSGPDNDIHIRNVSLDTVSGFFCSDIKRIALKDSTYTSATIQFRAPGIIDALGVDYWVVPEYTILPDTITNFAHTDTSVVTLTDLESASGYDVYARVICADSTVGQWTGPFTFHTVACSEVTGIKPDNFTLSSVTLELQAPDADAAIGYETMLTEADGLLDPTEAIRSVGPRVDIAYDFAASTDYDVYVRKICQVGDTAEWAGPFKLHTPYGVPFEVPMQVSSVPEGWNTYRGRLDSLVSTTSGWSGGRAGYAFEKEHLYCGAPYDEMYLITSPIIDLTKVNENSPIEFTFDMALTGYYSTTAPSASNIPGKSFYVLVNDGSGWQYNRGFSWKSDGTGHYNYQDIQNTGAQYALDLTDYAGRSIQLGFCHAATSSGSCEIHIQNLYMDTIGSEGSCQRIGSLSFPVIGTSSVDVEITFRATDPDPLPSRVTELEFALDADFSMIARTQRVTGDRGTITGLTTSTTYYVRARRLCQSGDFSSYSRPVVLTTAYGLRYVEDFESPDRYAGWTRYSGDDDAVFAGGSLQTPGSSPWSRNTSDTYCFTTPHLQMNIYNVCSSWIVSPSIDLTPNVGQSLLFMFDLVQCAYSGHGAPKSSADDQFKILVSTDDGKTWSAANSFVWNNQGTGDYVLDDLKPTPTSYILDFSRFAGNVIRIAFYGKSTESGGTDNYLMVDNIDLSASATYRYSDTFCAGNDYAGHGFFIPAEQITAGQLNFRQISAAHDSVSFLELDVLPSPELHLTDEICQGEVYNSNGFSPFMPTHSDVYRLNRSGINGCDSTMYLHLTVHEPKKANVNLYGCQGTPFVFDGKTYVRDAVFQRTEPSAVTGCDSITTYFLTFSDSETINVEERVFLCRGESYKTAQNTYTKAGTYEEHYVAQGGCDSVVTIHVALVNAKDEIVDKVGVTELPYIYNDMIFVPAGGQPNEYHFANVETGCGLKTLILTVYDNTALTDPEASRGLRVRKELHDGRIYIRVDGKCYDSTGREVVR